MKKSIFTLLVAILAFGTQLSFAQAPAVEAELLEATTTTIKVKLTPNAATGTYHVVAYKTGEMEKTFDVFAEMFEWNNYSDLVMSQGESLDGEQEYLIERVNPSTKRELWILPTDADGTYGELQHYTFSTIAQGGDGEAKIEVEILEYNAAGEEQLIKYIPNDQTNYYLSLVVADDELDNFGGSIEGAVSFLQTMDANEEYHPLMASYYEETVYALNVYADKAYTVVSIARNAKDEWGPVDVKNFIAGADPTKIGAVNSSAADGQLFNLQGQKVSVPRGIVIKNGKKYVVK